MASTNLPIRVAIADDHDFFRDGLKAMLQKHAADYVRIVAEARNGAELVGEVERANPDVVVTDIKMPQMDGLEACRIITSQAKSTSVIALSSSGDSSLIYDMVEAGAKGYLLKNTPREEIVEAIKTVHSGEMYYCSTSSMHLLRRLAPSGHSLYLKNPSVKFSPLERQVIRLICEQLTSKEIAEKLGMHIRTIEDYSMRIKDKTGARNLVGIALFAIKNDMVKAEDI